MAKSITNQSSFLAKKTGRVAKNVFYMKTSTPDIIDAYDEPDSDFPNPGHTLEQVFDQEKADLLRKIRTLFRMASKIELDDSNEDENDLDEELILAQDIVRRLMRIENYLMWPYCHCP